MSIKLNPLPSRDNDEFKIIRKISQQPPRSGKLKPIQLKRSIKPSSAKFTIDCEKNQNETPKTVESFLKELNLLKFISNFMNNGIDNIEKLSYVNNDHLKMINIPYACRLKILKKIKDEGLNQFEKNTQKIHSDIYDELILPTEEDDKPVNEEEQRRTFTEAIHQFQKEQNIEHSTIKNSKTEAILADIGVGEDSIKNEIEREIYNESLVGTGEYQESNISTNKKFLPLDKKKTYCYQCLHMILQEHCILKYEKPFCCLHCLEMYEKKNIRECFVCKKKCQVVTMITTIDKGSRHFCSLNCLEIEEEKERKNPNNKTNKTYPNNKSSSSESEQMIDILDI